MVEGFGIEGLWSFAIVQYEFPMIIGGQFQEVVVWPLKGDRWTGQADDKVFTLLLPWEAVYEGDRVFEGAIFFFREFSRFIIVVLNF